MDILPASYEKDNYVIFPRNLSRQSLFFQYKLILLFFSAVSGVEIKTNAEIKAGSLSCLACDFAARFRAHGYAAHARILK